MRALIVGGGVGGLATAVALRDVGVEPLLFEQAPALTEIGAGINLWPNAMKALDGLGAAGHIRRTGVRGERVDHYDLASGKELESLPFGPTAEAFGGQLYNSHRADLLDALIGRLPSTGIRLGSRVVGFRESQAGVTVVLEDATEVSGDFLVGADGLKSSIRAQLFGPGEPEYTGVVAWRALLKRGDVPTAAVVPGIGSWFGADRTVVIYPVRRGELVSFSGYVPDVEVRRESWTASGSLDDLRTSFAGAAPIVRQVIGSITEAIITPIYFRRPLDNWCSERVVLLGDSAHPVPPFAGQGAALALEDAVVLARCIDEHRGAPIGRALAAYVNQRTERAVRVLTRSRTNLQVYRESDPARTRARNGRIRGLKRLDPAGLVSTTWLYGYDPRVDRVEPAGSRVVSWPEPGRRAFDLWRTAFTPDDSAASWVGERAAYERLLLGLDGNRGDRTDRLDCDGVPALRVTPPGPSTGPTVLHLHGGGYTMGSAESSAAYAGRLARAVGGTAVVVDYRLAPEHPFPAAFDDVMVAYRWLLQHAGGAQNVIVSGECAGAGLALGLAVALRDAGLPPPRALHLVSPLCDLSLSAPSIDAADTVDPWFDRVALTTLAASYAQGAAVDDGRMSPVYADLAGLPPVLIQAAANEALADDARRVAERLRASGGVVSLTLVAQSVHSFTLFEFLPEASAAIDEFARHAGLREGRA
ncbi:alpha/beta hydrolase fold domain-containing protein [Dactylosporangium sp. NPDC051485]|uniref:alpha/beta hydrolase fold domain-containing protein n=1 Tax=Dactylosporangium sp. NPDC051485 TaxID=3154846 RepID=UPI00343F5B12